MHLGRAFHWVKGDLYLSEGSLAIMLLSLVLRSPADHTGDHPVHATIH